MKTLAFALRNTKEIVRDKLNIAFGIGFPLVLLLLLSIIQSNIPVEMFAVDTITPGITVFGFSFIALFSGMLIAKDRTSSFMLRLFTSPMTSTNFILGYTVPLIPLAVIQATFVFVVSAFFGLELNLNILLTIFVQLPAAVLFIAIGLMCGSVLTDRQVGGICGALLTNLSAWLSDTWFDIELVGGVFAAVARALPFYHAVMAGRHALAGEYDLIFPDLWWVIGYALVTMAVAIVVFRRRMKGD